MTPRRWLRCFVLPLCAVAAFAATTSGANAQMIVWFELDGSSYLKNIGDTPLSMDGYTIASEANDLIFGDYDGTKGWKALEDILTQFPAEIGNLTAALGPGALTFGSANPGGGNLTELTLSPLGAVFEPGEQWFIGKPFAAKPIDDNGVGLPGYNFYYKLVSSPNPPVTGVPSIQGPKIPEPSSIVLAGLGLIGLLALARRSRGRTSVAC